MAASAARGVPDAPAHPRLAGLELHATLWAVWRHVRWLGDYLSGLPGYPKGDRVRCFMHQLPRISGNRLHAVLWMGCKLSCPIPKLYKGPPLANPREKKKKRPGAPPPPLLGGEIIAMPRQALS